MTLSPKNRPAGAERRSPMPVPPVLRDAAGWAWRVLVVGAVVFMLARIAARLYLVTLPLVAGVLFAALLLPLTLWMRRRRLPRGAAAAITVLIAFAVLGAIGFYVVDRAIAEYPTLVDKLGTAISRSRDFLVNGPLHLKSSQVDNWQKSAVDLLNTHRNSVAQGVLTGVRTFSEFLVGAVLAFFVTVFLLYDGDRIWDWIVRLFPPRGRVHAHEAGVRAWARLSGFVRGTFLICVFHAVVVAIALAIMGVPLVAPLALLVFLGSFIPIVGAFLFGGIAVVVTFVAAGLVPAIVLIVVLIVDNQIEAHILQPFLVGRYVRLHPLAIALAITAGGLIAGIAGAILAVPVTAAGYAVAHYFATGDVGEPPDTGAATVTDEEERETAEPKVPADATPSAARPSSKEPA